MPAKPRPAGDPLMQVRVPHAMLERLKTRAWRDRLTLAAYVRMTLAKSLEPRPRPTTEARP